MEKVSNGIIKQKIKMIMILNFIYSIFLTIVFVDIIMLSIWGSNIYTIVSLVSFAFMGLILLAFEIVDAISLIRAQIGEAKIDTIAKTSKFGLPFAPFVLALIWMKETGKTFVDDKAEVEKPESNEQTKSDI